jgi:hypothetical protein
MFKIALRLSVIFLFSIANNAIAQDSDTIEVETTDLTLTNKVSVQDIDTIHVDTAELNKLRIEPKKNYIPVPAKQIEVELVKIPVSLIDYEVNYWKKFVTIGINANQASFSSNWKGGGVNSVAISGNFNFLAQYNKNVTSYTSNLVLQYGKSKNKDQAARKNLDRIFWENKVNWLISKKWSFYGSVVFESQFDAGFSYPANQPPVLLSRFMAPAYTTESIGLEYKPAPYYRLAIGTGTARQTIVLDDSVFKRNSYGIKPGRKAKNDLAFQITSNFDKQIAKNLWFVNRFNMFIPYNNLRKVDYRMDATLTAQVNKMVRVQINSVVLYDDDQDKKIQFNESLSLGIVYKFPYF